MINNFPAQQLTLSLGYSWQKGIVSVLKSNFFGPPVLTTLTLTAINHDDDDACDTEKAILKEKKNSFVVNLTVEKDCIATEYFYV